MKNLLPLAILSIGLLFSLSGCIEDNNIQSLNSTYSKLERLELWAQKAPLDSINSVRDRLKGAKEDLIWLGADSNVVFIKSDALVIEELSKASRYLKDAPSRFIGVFNEITRCKSQISGLIGLIKSGAEIDALGDSIDNTYIKHNTLIEIEAVIKLEKVLTETLKLSRLGLESDSASWSDIDSLLLVKRGQWAQGIANVGEEL
jgi:hypothetical protein|tara:strand:- start:269 stop:877 length:609 start_codon:yes stop_codon:yes gene_type:complete